jgi:hypothetical protein
MQPDRREARQHVVVAAGRGDLHLRALRDHEQANDFTHLKRLHVSMGAAPHFLILRPLPLIPHSQPMLKGISHEVLEELLAHPYCAKVCRLAQRMLRFFIVVSVSG